MAWPSAIRHSKSANRHFQSAKRRSKSAEWHFSCAKWHAMPPSYFHAIPCNFAFSNIFLGSFNTQKDFFFRSNWGILMCHLICFQKSSLASLFSKTGQIEVFFFFPKTYEFMFQTRGIRPCLIHFQKRPPSSFFKKKIIIKISKKSCIHFKLGAFSSASFK